MREDELRGWEIQRKVTCKEIFVEEKKRSNKLIVVTGPESIGNTYFPLFAHIHFILLTFCIFVLYINACSM